MSHPVDTTTPIPAHGWTRERKALFLDRLSAHGNARAACRAVGLSAESAYKLRRRDPLFARGWAAAVVLGRDASIQALGERAIEGLEEEIYYRGELIGTRRRYDTRLLLAHLARLDQLADEKAAGADAGRFDELVACIAQGKDDMPDITRDQHIEEVAQYAEQRHRDEALDAYFDGLRKDGVEIDEASEWKYPVDATFQDELDRECEALVERSRQAAARGWKVRQRKACATVDALVAAPEARAAATDPVPSAILDAIRERATPAERTAFSFPCTQSTASTIALARTLAEPPPGWATTPRSPFTAPRRM